MAAGFVHTVHRQRRWLNEIEGDDGVLPGRHETKDEAVAAAKRCAGKPST